MNLQLLVDRVQIEQEYQSNQPANGLPKVEQESGIGLIEEIVREGGHSDRQQECYDNRRGP